MTETDTDLIHFDFAEQYSLSDWINKLAAVDQDTIFGSSQPPYTDLIGRDERRSLRARFEMKSATAATVASLLALAQATAFGERSDPIPSLLPAVRAQSSDWEEFIRKLESLTGLEDGWNGYSAPAPDEVAVVEARRFLSSMEKYGRQPTRIAASAVGGVGVTCRCGTRKVYIEFFNNGGISALFADDAAQLMFTKEVENAESEFDAIAIEIEDYLDG